MAEGAIRRTEQARRARGGNRACSVHGRKARPQMGQQPFRTMPMVIKEACGPARLDRQFGRSAAEFMWSK